MAETSKEPPAKNGVFEDARKTMEDAGLGALKWMGTAWVEQMVDLGAEVASFVAERIKEDAKVQHRILHCKSIPELQKVQLEFLTKAFTDYTAETGKIIELSTKVVPGSDKTAKSTPV